MISAATVKLLKDTTSDYKISVSRAKLKHTVCLIQPRWSNRRLNLTRRNFYQINIEVQLPQSTLMAFLSNWTRFLNNWK